jgi:ribosomal protein L7/L12
MLETCIKAKEEAAKIKQVLEAAGAKVEIK